MEGVPAAIFVVDSVGERTAVLEANKMEIPVISISDSNSNPLIITHPIPGNDDATKSLKILIDAIADSYGKGLEESSKSKVKSEKLETAGKEDSGTAVVDGAIADEVAVAEELVEKEAVQDSERKVE